MIMLANNYLRGTLLALLSLGGLSGCETVLDLPEPTHTPRIALKYMLSNDNPNQENDDLAATRTLFVSNSQRVFASREIRGRNDATVVIVDESGKVVERFVPVLPSSPYDTFNIGNYRQTMGLQGEPGRTYTLRATLPGLEPVESTQTLPKPAVIERAAFVKNDSKSNPNEVYGQISITVADDPTTANYYVAFARVIDSKNPSYHGWSQVQVEESDENLGVDISRFQLSTINSFSGYSYGLYPYADTNVNGQRFSLSANVRFYPGYCQQPANCARPDYMEVFVTSLTADAYNFFLSRQRYNDIEGNPFAEPAPLVSNIKPGYGIFGGMTDAVYRIKLPQ